MKKIHGMSKTKIYKIWNDMINRCRNKSDPDYHNYGARDIKVCKRWLNFATFYRDLGDPPKGLTIERLDNEKGYFPDNCEWATQKQNNNNKRTNIIIEYKGKKQTMKQWADKIGINYSTLKYRLRRAHWPTEQALTVPVRNHSQ